jgi:DNA segregation ATPase FtsK/SpoIIIE, S-DNA-T family
MILMARKNRKRKRMRESKKTNLHPEIQKSVWIIGLIGVAIILILSATGHAGPIGNSVFGILHNAFGVGYYLLPSVAFLFSLSLVAPEQKKLMGITAIGGAIFMLAGLGLIDIVSEDRGGYVGSIVGALEIPFGIPGALVLTVLALTASLLIIINRPITRLRLWRRKETQEENNVVEENSKIVTIDGAIHNSENQKLLQEDAQEEVDEKIEKKETKRNEKELAVIEPSGFPNSSGVVPEIEVKNYTPPPTSLLASQVEKPTIGDLRANANIIKRTLESFGIATEMGEINVGPTVTRYTLKPAEGVKIARITALNQDLALALASHPIRIEAPIPGKSLLGIEVPNKSSAIVRLGSLIIYPEFQKANPLTFALGRNVNGEPLYPDIAKMPHLLIAGATGSGKSIALHSLIVSLLFKNSPEMLRMILIDPKRVELSVYNKIPHLLSPVITENKKAIGALRWGIQEMDRRYQILMEEGARDIQSYNKKKATISLPYIIIVIDELADLMSSYGREVEGVIIRLAQMARATGIHLVVSTQRPSVEVITGLIKANITSRIALQVASQIDSRTILDSSGAEKLLGSGDLLFTTSDFSKPKRIQGGFLTEEEIKRVVQFIIKHNQTQETEESGENNSETTDNQNISSDENKKSHYIEDSENIESVDFGALGENSSEEDELYQEAVTLVREAEKASASFLQRRLRVGYARAARLLDLMEDRGVIGPGEGAKAREIL